MPFTKWNDIIVHLNFYQDIMTMLENLMMDISTDYQESSSLSVSIPTDFWFAKIHTLNSVFHFEKNIFNFLPLATNLLEMTCSRKSSIPKLNGQFKSNFPIETGPSDSIIWWYQNYLCKSNESVDMGQKNVFILHFSACFTWFRMLWLETFQHSVVMWWCT